MEIVYRMEIVQNTLIAIWQKDIQSRFKNGLVTYERQVQGEFYRQLKNSLPEEYEVWIEPVIDLPLFNLLKIKPDIFITHQDKIVGIMEIKFKPWEYVDYHQDLYKLTCLKDVTFKNQSFTLGYKPKSSRWKTQVLSTDNVTYQLADDYLSIYVVFARPDADALTLPAKKEIPTPFLYLYGYIIDENNLKFDFVHTSEIQQNRS
ncbi:hypothetical protein [Xanthocytophaga agilis]|uniref:Uncharacterized protein n=1 Tax=Xanthocytophaga agilis TaxID=3048010 RepID=A0AAE3UJ13_9BACT|nr:hypothetical protein [Xanthocytophaga agilis]MDJ1505247.1 hypothetical protein [Xanthocytophaga agilis]